jgi:hypothetical protein
MSRRRVSIENSRANGSPRYWVRKMRHEVLEELRKDPEEIAAETAMRVRVTARYEYLHRRAP